MKKILLLLMVLLTLVAVSGCAISDYGLEEADGKPRVSCTPYLYDIAEGNVEGHEGWLHYGYNPNVGTTEEAIWENSTTYSFPTTAIQMEVVSTDAADASGGTGITQLYIGYLDDLFLEHYEIVTTNGTTPVTTTATDIYRVNYFMAFNTGTGGEAAGNITLRTAGGGNTYAYILAGRTFAKQLIYTVPDDMILYITSATISSAEAAKGVRVSIEANTSLGYHTDAYIIGHFIDYTDIITYNTAIDTDLEIPLKFIEHTDIRGTTISTQAGALVTISLMGWLESDGHE